jgi:hypothetical protein
MGKQHFEGPAITPESVCKRLARSKIYFAELVMKNSFGLGILILFSISLLNSCAGSNASQAGNRNDHQAVSSTSIGIYHDDERILLEASFVNAVNRWLHRYSPRMIIQGDAYVKMQVKYDYLYDLELFIKDNRYEIVVTFSQPGRRPLDAQEDAVHLSTGLLKVMEDYIKNRSQSRNGR